jgi:hypothetical protein
MFKQVSNACCYCYVAVLLLHTQSCRFILNNYATTDRMASLCRAAIGASIVFGYPLTFITAREGILSALNIQEPSDTQVSTPCSNSDHYTLLIVLLYYSDSC